MNPRKAHNPMGGGARDGCDIQAFAAAPPRAAPHKPGINNHIRNIYITNHAPTRAGNPLPNSNTAIGIRDRAAVHYNMRNITMVSLKEILNLYGC